MRRSLTKLQNLDSSWSLGTEDLRSGLQVYFLDRTHQEWLHPSANRIPVLVLDYDQVR